MTGAIMAKSKPKKAGDGDRLVQFNIRVPARLIERMDRAAEALGTDRSHLMRMMMVKYLPAYEEEARIAAGGEP